MLKRLNIIIIVVLLALMVGAEYLPGLLRKPPTPVAVGQPQVIRFGGDSFAYNPASVTIHAGESVTWEGSFSTHPLASDTQEWYPHREGESFTYTFKRAGTYRFYCENHGAPNGGGMSGVIVVQ